MRTPAVSVVIPTYNRAHCIKDAIDSVLAQSLQDFELIVVDDGSTDSTEDLVLGYGNRIRYIKQDNHGAAHARNTGIKAANAEWIAFLDSDDLWEFDKLKVQIQDLLVNKEAVAHMVDAVITGENVQKQTMFQIRGLLHEFEKRPYRSRPLSDVLDAQFFTPCWTVRRKAVETAGYYDSSLRIFEDFNLLTRIALEGAFYVSCYNGVTVRRKVGGATELSSLYQQKRIEAFDSLFKTYAGLKNDARLDLDEYKKVSRRLGGVCCELFVEYKRQKKWKKGFKALFHSMVADPGLHSVLRASIHLAGGSQLMQKVKKRKNAQDEFRRSEFGDKTP